MSQRTAGLAIALLLTAASPAMAATMTEAECMTQWNGMDSKKTGYIMETESPRYFAWMRIAGKTTADGRMNRADYMTNCQAGVFSPLTNASASTAEPGAPFKGSNSFTEGQAKDRAIAAGFGTTHSKRVTVSSRPLRRTNTSTCQGPGMLR